MSQPKITIFYKTHKLNVTPIVQIKKPQNSSDCTQNKLNDENVINLVSSDEDILSDDSDKTVIIASKPLTVPLNSESLQSVSNMASNTPQNVKQSISELNDSLFDIQEHEASLTGSSDLTLTNPKTPESPLKYSNNKITTPTSSPKKKRFYSPTKKRNINEYTPNKRKNLASMFEYESDIDSSPSQISDTNDEFRGLDAKTKFLLDIINACLNDDSLKNLLDDEAQAVLVTCSSLPVHSLRTVCRLYWRRDGWYRKNKIVEIIKNGSNKVDDVLIEQILKNLIEQQFLKQVAGWTGEVPIEYEREIATSAVALHPVSESSDNSLILCLIPIPYHYFPFEEAINALVTLRVSVGSGDYLLSDGTAACLPLEYAIKKNLIDFRMGECAGPCYKLSEKCQNVLYRLYLLSYLGIDYSIIRDKKLEFMLLNVIAQRETFPMDSEVEMDNAGIVFENRPHFERKVAVTFLVDKTVFAFFGACSPNAVLCFESKNEVENHCSRKIKWHSTSDFHSTPQHNGLAERMNRTLVEKARCMLFHANLPKKLWAEAESNHRLTLLFFRFSQIRGYVHFHMRSNQNCISDSAEILAVAVYKNVLRNKKIALAIRRYKSMPIWLRRYTPGYMFVKIFCDGLVYLKKGKNVSQCELAVDIITSLLNQNLFRQNKRAQWYDEKALILHAYLHKSNEAAQVLLEGLSSNLNDEEKDIIRRRAKYLTTLKCVNLDVNVKKLLLAHAHMETALESSFPARHLYKQPMENQRREKILYENRLHNKRIFQSVEQYALNDYIKTGEFTHGSHWEGKIVVTLFTLIFWDIIYSTPPGVRGVFLSRYQRLPLDMYTEAFYTNRKAMIDKRLEMIEHRSMDTMLELLEFNWNSRPGNEVSCVDRSLGWQNLAAVVSCLGSKGVYVLCRRLARQYHYAHSGFPDLTLWNIHTKKIKFVEVKSDSDSPSMKQIQWMQYLIANGIDTEFCYVGRNTHKRSRQNSRATNKS
ncbi:hypothetical protein EVAR_21913_1 [Eumeta japonica]|uniref:Fanconi-associated nuclease n=1 Tax=Eumeta variegata TaxID=151549 RepID=A0A4C1XF34_EUMVA|nr:hypothetical protein EVAR_21913_1 [Eumeta japonica]